MIKYFMVLLIALGILPCCKHEAKQQKPDPVNTNIIAPETRHVVETDTGMTVQSRFVPPKGFIRRRFPDNTFAAYLRDLPLKPAGTKVYLYDGNEKSRQDVHAAVIDMDTGTRDLQQCADAVMRLTAEYLYAQKEYSRIHFNFTNGFVADYKTWRAGNRIHVDGNRVSWKPTSKESVSYRSFRNYLNWVFSYAGTLSLSAEMQPVSIEAMQIGDVFIQGGSPGHAVIVVDMAEHESTGEKVFLLAQSYMPAQEIHVLKNPGNPDLSPWYPLNFGNTLSTPEWQFGKSDLKRLRQIN